MTSARDVAKRLHHGVLASWRRRPRTVGGEALISFTFDDFPRSAYRTAGTILASHGARGTYYASPTLCGTEDALGAYYDADDLRDLTTDGHELGSHTFSHASCRRMSPAAFVADIGRGEHALRALAGVAPSGNFSYPFGEVTFGAKPVVGGACHSCRGTMAGINGPTVDLNLLRANRLYSTSIDLADVRDLIARHARPGAWLIFYTHDVRDTPSAYGCTPGYFEAVVRASAASGARVVTVAAALGVLSPRPAPNA